MAFSLNVAQMITGSVTGLFKSALIIGLPSLTAPVPVFCMCEIPEERAHASARLPGNLTQAGELRARTVIEPSTLELDLVLSDIPSSADQSIYRAVQIALADAALVTNSLATYGLVLPNLSGLAVGYVASCLSVLNQIKNYMMPVMVLGSYIPLGVLQQTTPYLISGWYIDDIGIPHDAGKAGIVVTVRLKEQFVKKNQSILGAVMSVASAVPAANGGSAIGGMF